MKKLFLLLPAFLLLLFSCQKGDISAPPLPENPAPTLNLSSSTVFGSASAFHETVEIFTQGDWTVSVPGGADWVSVSPANGTDTGAVTISVTKSDADSMRSASLKVTAGNNTKTITVLQASAGEQSLAVYKKSVRVSYGAVSDTLLIITAGDWSVTDLPSWATVTPSNGTGVGQIVVSVDENTEVAQRSGIFNVKTSHATMPVSVVQNGHEFKVSPAEINGKYLSFTDSIFISTGKSWTLENLPAWITATPNSGTGNSKVIFTVDKNNTTAQRSADVKVTSGGISKTVTVTQAFTTFSVINFNSTIGWEGGTAKLSIDAPDLWTITSITTSPVGSWITQPYGNVPIQGSHVDFEFPISKNLTSADRVATFHISYGGVDKTVTITQKVNPKLDISQPLAAVEPEGNYLKLWGNGTDLMAVSGSPGFSIPQGQSLSISLKIQVGNSGSPTNPRIFFMGDVNGTSVGEGYELFMQMSSGHLQFNANDDNGNYVGSFLNAQSTNIKDGNWHHVVAVFDYDAKACYLYVDGVKEGSQDLSSMTIGNITPANQSLYIGDWGGFAGGWNFDGIIDDFRVWNKALSKEEVYADAANISLPDNSNNLMVGWDFDGAAAGAYGSVVSSQLQNGAAIGH